MTETMNTEYGKLYKTEAVATIGEDAKLASVWIDAEKSPNLYALDLDGGLTAIGDADAQLFRIIENDHYMFVVTDAGDVATIDIDAAANTYVTGGMAYERLQDAIDAAVSGKRTCKQPDGRIDYTRILDAWDDEWWLMDWYAVDSYDPVTERIERVMVGTAGDALHYMREYATQPAEVAFSRFYRCQVISAQSARRFFEHMRENPGGSYELMDESIETVSLNEAAAALGVSRQRAHVLYREGRILGHKVRGKVRIDAASVQRFIRDRDNRADAGR